MYRTTAKAPGCYLYDKCYVSDVINLFTVEFPEAVDAINIPANWLADVKKYKMKL